MTRIFISYRRSDSATIAGRIYDRLAAAFTENNVFKDSYGIQPGEDFRGKIREQIATCDVVLVIIGSTWLSVTEADNPRLRRLDNPADWVRVEVETGLQRDKAVVIPVLVGGASMPRADDLPVSLRELAYKNAVNVRDDPDFRNDIKGLIDYLKTIPDTPPMDTKPAKTSAEKSAPQKRLLEAAMPACTKLKTSTEVRAKISLPGSDGLRAELPDVLPSGDIIQKGDVRSSSFPMRFPVDPQSGELLPGIVCVKAVANDFIIQMETAGNTVCGDDQVELELLPDEDSRTVIFDLHPKPGAAAGVARVFIRLYQGEKMVAETSVATRLVQTMDEHPSCGAWQLATTAVNTAPRNAPAPAPPAVIDILPAPTPKPARQVEEQADFASPAPEPQPAPPPRDSWKKEREAAEVQQNIEQMQGGTVIGSQQNYYGGGSVPPPAPVAPAASPLSRSEPAAPKRRLNEPWAIILGAVITGFFALFAASLPSLLNPNNPTLSPDVTGMVVGTSVGRTEAVQTITAKMTGIAVMTAVSMQMTAYAQETHKANLTATAISWTATPTPNIRRTAEALLTQTQQASQITQNAMASATASWLFDRTATALWLATASAWTVVPTNSPTATPTPSPTPTPAPAGEGTLRLYVEDDTLIVYVASNGPVNLAELQFRVADVQNDIRLADDFDVLQLSQGMAEPGSCFVYRLSGSTTPLPGVCTQPNRIFRRDVTRADVFWHDFVLNQPRTIQVFNAGTAVALCPASAPDCSIDY